MELAWANSEKWRWQCETSITVGTTGPEEGGGQNTWNRELKTEMWTSGFKFGCRKLQAAQTTPLHLALCSTGREKAREIVRPTSAHALCVILSYHIISYHIVSVQVDKMVEEMLSETQCDSCFETATSARTLNGVCIVSPAVVHCVDCDQNLCASCCDRLCKRQSTQADVCNLLWHYSTCTVNLVAIRRIIGIQIHRLVYNILLTIFWRN